MSVSVLYREPKLLKDWSPVVGQVAGERFSALP